MFCIYILRVFYICVCNYDLGFKRFLIDFCFGVGIGLILKLVFVFVCLLLVKLFFLVGRSFRGVVIGFCK